jgi:hypothetical protein
MYAYYTLTFLSFTLVDKPSWSHQQLSLSFTLRAVKIGYPAHFGSSRAGFMLHRVRLKMGLKKYGPSPFLSGLRANSFFFKKKNLKWEFFFFKKLCCLARFLVIKKVYIYTIQGRSYIQLRGCTTAHLEILKFAYIIL